MELDGGVIHNELHLKGVLAQKSRDFRAHPFKRPEKWISPNPNSYVQPHKNNRYIGNFMDKKQETRDFRAHSEMVYIKQEGEESEGENKRCGRVGSARGRYKRGGGGDRNRCFMNS